MIHTVYARFQTSPEKLEYFYRLPFMAAIFPVVSSGN